MKAQPWFCKKLNEYNKVVSRCCYKIHNKSHQCSTKDILHRNQQQTTITEKPFTTGPQVENKLGLVHPYSQDLSTLEVTFTGENVVMKIYSFQSFSICENLC